MNKRVQRQTSRSQIVHFENVMLMRPKNDIKHDIADNKEID